VPNVRGIQLEVGLDHQVRCNTITTNQRFGVQHYGINAVDAAEVVYNYNTINGGTQGLAFRGACNNSDVWGNRFNSTTTKPMAYSLVYNVDPTSPNPPATVSIVGPQTNRFNRWKGAFMGTNNTGIEYNSGLPSSVPSNQWTVKGQTGSGYVLSPPNCGSIAPNHYLTAMARQVPYPAYHRPSMA
jgi:hypothetical protein